MAIRSNASTNRSTIACLYDPNQHRWRLAHRLVNAFTTYRHTDVVPIIAELQQATEHHGYHAIGFLAFEAASAMDTAFPIAAPPKDFPLLWFGLFSDLLHSKALPPAHATEALSPWQADRSPTDYHHALNRIRDYIDAGDIYQANLTYRLLATGHCDPWSLFRSRVTPTVPPYSAYLDTGEWVVCSFSPELFLQQDGDLVKSCPMKGTAPRGLHRAHDRAQADRLHRSPKERAENLMIVDMVRNDLSRIARTGSVRVPALFTVERYPQVWQMTSTITAQTSANLASLLQATFPPASVTGAPKVRAVEIITSLETSPRGLYTGCIGSLGPGRQAQFNVAIRTVVHHRPSATWCYGTGSGIVWDSDSREEWEETHHKARVLTEPRPRFSLLETLLWRPGTGFFLLAQHLQRLRASAEYFQFDYDERAIARALDRFADPLPTVPYRIRLLVANDGEPTVAANPITATDRHYGTVTLANRPINKDDVFLYHKTTWRKVYDTCHSEHPTHDDVILYNNDNQITESTRANLAFERSGKLYTPPLEAGLLPGTYRAWLLEQGVLHEGHLPLDDLATIPRVYLMNSVKGLQPIVVTVSR